MNERILIVEDEDTLRESLCRVFERERYEVVAVSSAEQALELFEVTPFHLAITDIILPGMTGIELIKRMKEAAPDQASIVMTAYASLETAVETLRAGAYDYIVKPIIHEEIKQTVRNALKMRALQEENFLLKEQVESFYDVNPIIGNHPEIPKIGEVVKALVESRCQVLIAGEMGTGKKLIARAIHFSSPWARFPFVEANCGSLSPHEQEEALFGHAQGVVPKAGHGSRSLLQKADGGTLYINGVDKLSRQACKRLLEVIEEKQIRFLTGEMKPLKVDPLIIVGTENDPGSLVSSGKFDEELYERLTGIRIQLPPLRERGEDIEELADFFIMRYCALFDKPVKGLSEEVRQRLKAYSWPGNILELRNLVERAVLLTQNDRLEAAEFRSLF